MKQDTRHRSQVTGFTLIEMLTVIAIIAILVGILYPALRTIRDGPKKAQARADIRKLQLAIQSYYNEYGKWPASTRPALSGGHFYAMMNGNRWPDDGGSLTSGYEVNNPRGIKFMDFPRKQMINDEFCDPWGNPYCIAVDNGSGGIGPWWLWEWWGDITAPGDPPAMGSASDGMIMDRTNGAYGAKRQIGVYSFGPNGTNDDAQGAEYDDITSWY